jgi:hypothetical protein
VVLLDSTKNFKGSFSPEVKIQTQKELFVEISSVTDLVFRLKNNSLTLAQKTEFTAIGDQTALSGGYVFAKWKSNKNGRLIPEYFAQIQWADARGLQFKNAVGANLRYAFLRNAKAGLFAGLGGFYEYEKWNYNGVKDELRPPDTSPITQKTVRMNFYLSYKKWFSEKFFLDASFYYQPRFDQFFQSPRLASSTGLNWKISKYLQLGTQYQNIYDVAPIVPINNWFHRFTSAFSVNF